MTELAALLQRARRAVFFGGAGVSTESNIPDFRSEDGLYQERRCPWPPEEMLSHDFFFAHTREFYAFYFARMIYPQARPNGAHRALAALEQAGILRAVVTQNIDGLHQAAGSRNVLELHGSVHRNFCVECGAPASLAEMMKWQGHVPRCSKCGGLLKPDVVLYGEPLDQQVVEKAVQALRAADLLIVGGTSLAVYPAAGLLQYFGGDRIVLLNRDATPYDSRADLVLRGPIGQTLHAAVREIGLVKE